MPVHLIIAVRRKAKEDGRHVVILLIIIVIKDPFRSSAR
jgi:hypothetical protein